jgi:hypothetical protein
LVGSTEVSNFGSTDFGVVGKTRGSLDSTVLDPHIADRVCEPSISASVSFLVRASREEARFEEER